MKSGAMPPDRCLELTIRRAEAEDREDLWAILKPMIRSGETYALPREWGREETLCYWLSPERTVFVAETEGRTLGTYYLRANQLGGGGHVANCGYVTAHDASGRGVASAMCTHSLQYALARGFLAMQFNFVVSSNRRAIKLWERLGFETVGRLPAAFQHPRLGFVDALVMHRLLADASERPI